MLQTKPDLHHLNSPQSLSRQWGALQTEAVHTDGTRLPVTFSIQASFSVLIRNNWVTKSERIAWADPKAQRSRPSSLAFSHE